MSGSIHLGAIQVEIFPLIKQKLTLKHVYWNISEVVGMKPMLPVAGWRIAVYLCKGFQGFPILMTNNNKLFTQNQGLSAAPPPLHGLLLLPRIQKNTFVSQKKRQENLPSPSVGSSTDGDSSPGIVQGNKTLKSGSLMTDTFKEFFQDLPIGVTGSASTIWGPSWSDPRDIWSHTLIIIKNQ